MLDDVVVATTDNPDDDAVKAECQRIGVSCFRGAEDDVLTRFIGALDAQPLPSDAVMRLTADCPLLDPSVLRGVGALFRNGPLCDYVTTATSRTLPRGMDAEVVSVDALRRVHDLAEGHHRSHVTSYVYSHPEGFRIAEVRYSPSTAHLRLTLDTPEDLELIRAVVQWTGDVPGDLWRIVRWLDEHPDVSALNAHIEQKPLASG
jgi:spore coat polysaccharide biosynthesis protein SpsF